MTPALEQIKALPAPAMRACVVKRNGYEDIIAELTGDGPAVFRDDGLYTEEQVRELLAKERAALQALRDEAGDARAEGMRRWAQGLIEQLPVDHDGRNSWLLNFGIGDESDWLRTEHKRYQQAWQDWREGAPQPERRRYTRPAPAAEAAPCDMGTLCIGCTPRNPDGSCPGAAEATPPSAPVGVELAQLADRIEDAVNHPRVSLADVHMAARDVVCEAADRLRELSTPAAEAAPQGGDELLADLELIWHSVSDDKHTNAAYERLKAALAATPPSAPAVDEPMLQALQQAVGAAAAPLLTDAANEHAARLAVSFMQSHAPALIRRLSAPAPQEGVDAP